MQRFRKFFSKFMELPQKIMGSSESNAIPETPKDKINEQEQNQVNDQQQIQQQQIKKKEGITTDKLNQVYDIPREEDGLSIQEKEQLNMQRESKEFSINQFLNTQSSNKEAEEIKTQMNEQLKVQQEGTEHLSINQESDEYSLISSKVQQEAHKTHLENENIVDKLEGQDSTSQNGRDTSKSISQNITDEISSKQSEQKEQEAIDKESTQTVNQNKNNKKDSNKGGKIGKRVQDEDQKLIALKINTFLEENPNLDKCSNNVKQDFSQFQNQYRATYEQFRERSLSHNMEMITSILNRLPTDLQPHQDRSMNKNPFYLGIRKEFLKMISNAEFRQKALICFNQYLISIRLKTIDGSLGYAIRDILQTYPKTEILDKMNDQILIKWYVNSIRYLHGGAHPILCQEIQKRLPKMEINFENIYEHLLYATMNDYSIQGDQLLQECLIIIKQNYHNPSLNKSASKIFRAIAQNRCEFRYPDLKIPKLMYKIHNELLIQYSRTIYFAQINDILVAYRFLPSSFPRDLLTMVNNAILIGLSFYLKQENFTQFIETIISLKGLPQEFHPSVKEIAKIEQYFRENQNSLMKTQPESPLTLIKLFRVFKYPCPDLLYELFPKFKSSSQSVYIQEIILAWHYSGMNFEEYCKRNGNKSNLNSLVERNVQIIELASSNDVEAKTQALKELMRNHKTRDLFNLIICFFEAFPLEPWSEKFFLNLSAQVMYEISESRDYQKNIRFIQPLLRSKSLQKLWSNEFQKNMRQLFNSQEKLHQFQARQIQFFLEYNEFAIFSLLDHLRRISQKRVIEYMIILRYEIWYRHLHKNPHYFKNFMEIIDKFNIETISYEDKITITLWFLSFLNYLKYNRKPQSYIIKAIHDKLSIFCPYFAYDSFGPDIVIYLMNQNLLPNSWASQLLKDDKMNLSTYQKIFLQHQVYQSAGSLEKGALIIEIKRLVEDFVTNFKKQSNDEVVAGINMLLGLHPRFWREQQILILQKFRQIISNLTIQEYISICKSISYTRETSQAILEEIFQVYPIFSQNMSINEQIDLLLHAQKFGQFKVNMFQMILREIKAQKQELEVEQLLKICSTFYYTGQKDDYFIDQVIQQLNVEEGDGQGWLINHVLSILFLIGKVDSETQNLILNKCDEWAQWKNPPQVMKPLVSYFCLTDIEDKEVLIEVILKSFKARPQEPFNFFNILLDLYFRTAFSHREDLLEYLNFNPKGLKRNLIRNKQTSELIIMLNCMGLKTQTNVQVNESLKIDLFINELQDVAILVLGKKNHNTKIFKYSNSLLTPPVINYDDGQFTGYGLLFHKILTEIADDKHILLLNPRTLQSQSPEDFYDQLVEMGIKSIHGKEKDDVLKQYSKLTANSSINQNIYEEEDEDDDPENIKDEVIDVRFDI